MARTKDSTCYVFPTLKQLIDLVSEDTQVAVSRVWLQKQFAEKAAKEMKSSILNKEEPKPEDSPEFTVTDFEEQEKAA